MTGVLRVSPPLDLEVHGRVPSPCCVVPVARQGGVLYEELSGCLLEAGGVCRFTRQSEQQHDWRVSQSPNE